MLKIKICLQKILKSKENIMQLRVNGKQFVNRFS